MNPKPVIDLFLFFGSQVVVSHGKVIELLRPDASGKVQSICSMECFGLVRSMVSFRLPGANKDFLVLGSDSVSDCRNLSIRNKVLVNVPQRQTLAGRPLFNLGGEGNGVTGGRAESACSSSTRRRTSLSASTSRPSARAAAAASCRASSSPPIPRAAPS